MNNATNTAAYTITANRAAFRPERLEVMRMDRETADLLDEGGANGFACNFWAVLDRSRYGVRACIVELGADNVAALRIDTAREFFADDLEPVFVAPVAA